MPRSPETIVDELLLLRCQSGDVAAVNEIIRQWTPRLRRHAWRLTKQHDLAADVVQDAWIAIVRGLPKLREPNAFPKWAYRIVTHKSVDAIRCQQRQRSLVEESAKSQSICHDSNVDEVGGDDVSALRHGIRQLSRDQQAIIAMFYLDECSIADISASLGIPSGTVKSRLHTAREHLKQILERTSHVEH